MKLEESDPIVGPLHTLGGAIRSAAATACSEAYAGKYLEAITVAADYFTSTRRVTAWSPCRSKSSDQLVRVYFNFDHDGALASDVRAQLKQEIEPYIIGAGNVRVDCTEDGLVVMRADG